MPLTFAEILAKYVPSFKRTTQRETTPIGKVVVPAGTRRNNKAAPCDWPGCPIVCDVGQGFIQKEAIPPNYREVWKVYCLAHYKQAAQGQPQPGTASPVVPPAPRYELTAEGEIYAPYDATKLTIYRSFPGRNTPGAFFNKEKKCWEVSLKEQDRYRVLELADALGLKVAEELRAVPQSTRLARAKDADLFPFQVQGVAWLAARERSALLGDEMGLGKTVQTIMSWPDNPQVLIVAPKGVKYNWQKECRTWRPELRCYVGQGGHMFALPNPGEVIIVNYEMLPDWLRPVKEVIKNGKKIKMAEVPTEMEERLKNIEVVWDEAHMLSNWKSGRSQKAKQLNERIRKRVGLTGTPLLNRQEQLLGILMSLNMLGETFRSVHNFRFNFNASQEPIPGGRGTHWVYRDPLPEVPGILRRVMLRRTRKEVLPDLPDKTHQILQLDNIPRPLAVKMEHYWQQFQQTPTFQQGELPPFEEMAAIRAEIAESRVQPVLEYVEDAEYNDVPLIVASAHRAPIDALAGRPGWFTITGDTGDSARQDIVEMFQRGWQLVRGSRETVNGVGLTIRAGGVGLTLTRAWLMLFADREWTPSLNSQCEDRICRIGQKSQKVQITTMTSNHPLEIHLTNLLIKKQGLITAAVERDVIPRKARRQS